MYGAFSKYSEKPLRLFLQQSCIIHVWYGFKTSLQLIHLLKSVATTNNIFLKNFPNSEHNNFLKISLQQMMSDHRYDLFKIIPEKIIIQNNS